jgi:hypothetical protein
LIQTVNRIVYCETCQREVKLVRRHFKQKYNELICFLTLFTIGIGYIILKYTRKKDTCPYCERRFDLTQIKTKKLKENDDSS